MKKRPLKVYGGTFDGRHRVICATTSGDQFVREVNDQKCGPISHYQFKLYASQTWNETEVALAMSEPERVFVHDTRKRGNLWTKAKKS